MRAGDQPPMSGPDPYRGGGRDERWSHFDDTTSQLDFRMDGPYADDPTAKLRPYRGGHADPPGPWWRSRTALIVAASFLAVVLIGTVTFIALRPDPTPAAADPGPTGSSSPTPSGSPSPTPSPSPSPTPSQTTTTTPPAQNPVPVEPPTQPPPPAEQPPAPPPPAPPECSPTYDGENAPFAEVRAALEAAASKRFWQGVVKPEGYLGDGSDIVVPLNFVKAVAYQESGWQSAIRACDGGMGTMQVMTGTIDQINQRFGVGYSIPLDLRENTEAGVNYLQWLYMYFGLYYYNGNFDDPYLQAPVGPDGQMLMLIDAVVSAYNVGPAALERNDGTHYYLSVPNWNYVNAVWHFAEEECPCDELV